MSNSMLNFGSFSMFNAVSNSMLNPVLEPVPEHSSSLQVILKFTKSKIVKKLIKEHSEKLKSNCLFMLDLDTAMSEMLLNNSLNILDDIPIFNKHGIAILLGIKPTSAQNYLKKMGSKYKLIVSLASINNLEQYLKTHKVKNVK